MFWSSTVSPLCLRESALFARTTFTVHLHQVYNVTHKIKKRRLRRLTKISRVIQSLVLPSDAFVTCFVTRFVQSVEASEVSSSDHLRCPVKQEKISDRNFHVITICVWRLASISLDVVASIVRKSMARSDLWLAASDRNSGGSLDVGNIIQYTGFLT